jgi:hypothetical protein
MSDWVPPDSMTGMAVVKAGSHITEAANLVRSRAFMTMRDSGARTVGFRTTLATRRTKHPLLLPIFTLQQGT